MSEIEIRVWFIGEQGKTKKFKSQAALERFLEKHEGDIARIDYATD